MQQQTAYPQPQATLQPGSPIFMQSIQQASQQPSQQNWGKLIQHPFISQHFTPTTPRPATSRVVLPNSPQGPVSKQTLRVIRSPLTSPRSTIHTVVDWKKKQEEAAEAAELAAHRERQEQARCKLRQATDEAAQIDIASADLETLKKARADVQLALIQAREVGLPRSDLLPAERLRRRFHNAVQDSKGRIRVCCRIRPLSAAELSRHEAEAVSAVDDRRLEVQLPGGVQQFTFNSVFGPEEESSQEIFEDCRDLAQSAGDGHNVTVFSYGQTGAGKTYTMFGNKGQDGLAQQMVHEVFACVAELSREHTDPRVTMTGSVMELYNNHLVDLLRPIDQQGRQDPGLKIGIDSNGSVEVDGLKQKPVRNPTELLAVLGEGLSQRLAAQHVLNFESSRSHMIFTVTLWREAAQGKSASKSKLIFCDLGGCERLKRTQVVGELQREAIEINKSLSALCDVIGAVADKRSHVPYRNHKLTCLLSDALGGTSKVLMYACCTPAQSGATETAAVLRLATRAKGVANQQRSVVQEPREAQPSE